MSKSFLAQGRTESEREHNRVNPMIRSLWLVDWADRIDRRTFSRKQVRLIIPQSIFHYCNNWQRWPKREIVGKLIQYYRFDDLLEILLLAKEHSKLSWDP